MIERGEDFLGRTGDADIIGNRSDLDVAGRILRTVQETSDALAEVEGARRVTLTHAILLLYHVMQLALVIDEQRAWLTVRPVEHRSHEGGALVIHELALDGGTATARVGLLDIDGDADAVLHLSEMRTNGVDSELWTTGSAVRVLGATKDVQQLARRTASRSSRGRCALAWPKASL